ncbi:MAG: tartrate dehydrogenase [Desulfobacteraceae bacterium]|nr:tartrate dehydrogenase [Desulfobacteraceae bacterium]
MEAKAGSTYNIAVIAGDGIGREVMPEGMRVLEEVGHRCGIGFNWLEYPWSCDYYRAHGRMCPEDAMETLSKSDSIFLGAIGQPDVPDHISLWQLLMPIRRSFDQYVNLRPVRLFRGISCPLAGMKPGDIDYYVVRENSEGEYSQIGGRMFTGTPRETAFQESVFTRTGMERIMKYAFELARKLNRPHVTSATKSNGIIHTLPFWDQVFNETSARYPGIRANQLHIDAFCANLVLKPQAFDVIVASNLFGDILSDLGPATTGSLGIAPSGNLNPEREHPSMFEPVHGSAPDIAGRHIANPIGQIWSGAMMLRHLGHGEAADMVEKAIETVLAEGKTRTPDLGGKSSTEEVGKAIAGAVC